MAKGLVAAGLVGLALLCAAADARIVSSVTMPALRLRGGAEGDGAAGGGAGMPPGLPGMPPGFDMNAMNSMFQNPAFQNMASNLMNNPEFKQRMDDMMKNETLMQEYAKVGEKVMGMMGGAGAAGGAPGGAAGGGSLDSMPGFTGGM